MEEGTNTYHLNFTVNSQMNFRRTQVFQLLSSE